MDQQTRRDRQEDLVVDFDFDAVTRQLLTEQRLARFQEVVADRLGCLTVVFDRMIDPHNGSACVRVCDAFGIQDVTYLAEREYRMNRDIAMASDRWVDIHHVESNAELVDTLRRQGFTLAGGVVPGDGGIPYTEIELPEKLALVMGSERVGLDPGLRAACDLLIHIPTVGFVDSLNLSTATAVLLQHLTSAYRARGGDIGLPEARQQALVEAWCARDVKKKLRGNPLPENVVQ